MKQSDSTEELKKAYAAVGKTVACQRLHTLFDQGSFLPIGHYTCAGEAYTNASAGYGTVRGRPAFAFAQSSDLLGGALDQSQAQKIQKLCDMAVQNGAPLIGIYDSAGAKLTEGTNLLNSYGDVLHALRALSGVVPLVSLVAGPCIGTAALAASCADFVILTEQAELTLSSGGTNGSADEASKSGTAALVEPDEAAGLEAVRRLLLRLPSNNLAAGELTEEQSADMVLPVDASAREAVRCVVNSDSALELWSGFGDAVYTALAAVGTCASVGVLTYDGELDADACAKAAHFLRFCDAFSLPVITFVNAFGFQSLHAAAALSAVYAEATTVKAAVLTGRACGPVYLAFCGHSANADYTIAWPKAVVSPLTPETGAVFLWSSRLAGAADPTVERKRLIAQYAAEECSPLQAAAHGLVDDVLLPEKTRAALLQALQAFSAKRAPTLPRKHSCLSL